MTSDDSAPRVVFIVGSQRGGTTVLGRVLGTVPGLAYGGELRRLWERGLGAGRTCGCGRPFDECEFWAPVLERVAADGVDWRATQRQQASVAPTSRTGRRLGPLLASEQSADALAYGWAMGRLYAAVVMAHGGAVLVDSSKLPADAVLVARASGADVKVLHVVRDPRGVVASQLRRVGRGARSAGAGRAAWRWSTRHRRAADVAALVGPQRFLTVRYEDFVADPGAVLDRIAAFAGAAAPPCGSGPFALPEVHTPGGPNPAESDLTLREDLRWRTDLRGLPFALVRLLSHRPARRFGYRW